jgi:hypothetical protein
MNYGLRTDKTAKGFESVRARLEAEKNKPGADGIFARAMLEFMPAMQRFFEGEVKKGTSVELINAQIAATIANMVLMTGQLQAKKRDRQEIGEKILGTAGRIVERKLGVTAGGVLLPGGSYSN